jgi:RNA polymerase sigma-70 factor, ECF subfamily
MNDIPGSASSRSPEIPDSPQKGGSANNEQDGEDRRLVRLHHSGDTQGFEQLYLRHRERIFAVLMRMLRNREDALDATQEVFIRIHKALDGFDPSGRFLTWAYRISTNHAIDRIRRRKVRKEQSIVEEAVSDRQDLRTGRSGENSPQKHLEQAEISEAVSRAVDQLGDAHRMVFTLFCYEGLSYGEIAAVMEIPVGTVMSRLYHARRKVRDSLPVDWDPGGPRKGKQQQDEGEPS